MNEWTETDRKELSAQWNNDDNHLGEGVVTLALVGNWLTNGEDGVGEQVNGSHVTARHDVLQAAHHVPGVFHSVEDVVRYAAAGLIPTTVRVEIQVAHWLHQP